MINKMFYSRLILFKHIFDEVYIYSYISFMRIFILFLVFFTQQLLAASDFTRADKAQRIETFIKNLNAHKNEVHGGAIAILYKGHVVYKSTFGYQKDKFSEHITPKTLFPLASVSKAVSASALALMVEDGTLSLDEHYKLPYLQNPVTMKNILSHTTGYRFSGNNEIEVGYSRAKLLKTLEAQKPVCNPGNCYSYSNTTFSLIEEALNSKSLNLDAAMKKLRDMLHTNEIQIEPIDPDTPVAYPHVVRSTKRRFFFKLLPMPPYYPKVVPAAAGVFASLDGMIEVFKLNFGYRPDLISKETLDIFHTPVTPNYDLMRWNIDWGFPKKKLRSYYGLGWRIIQNVDKPEKSLIFHSGHISGVRSFIGYLPEEELGMIFLTNQDDAFSVKKGFEFWGMFLNNNNKYVKK